MAAVNNKKTLPRPQLIGILLIGFLVVIAALVYAGMRLSSNFRQDYDQQLAEQLQSPQTAVKEETRRVLLKQVLEDGTVQYIELLASGEINVYDEDMNLIKSGITGYYRVDSLFDKINRNLGSLDGHSLGSTTITIETNKGTYIIIVDEELLGEINDNIGDIIDEIIDDIEDIADDAFAPTPTFAPTTTPYPGQSTPTPSPTLPPGVPTPTPPPNTPGPSPTPTPLPDYMIAPPFSCDDYKDLGRPVTISNIICGVD